MTPRLFLLLLVSALCITGIFAPLPARAGISAEPTGPEVTVDTPQALTQAYLDLSAWDGAGGTIYLAPGFPRLGEIALEQGGDNPVHITSADPADPNAVLGERLSMIRYGRDITVAGNHISGYEQGLTFQEIVGLRVSGNEITAIQGDGIRIVGVSDVRIEGNYLHDFSATPNEFTHSDFIQMWSRNAEIISHDITITGNIMDTGNGVAVQAIWLGNPVFARGDSAHVYRDITITDNLIYTGAANGIGVTGAQDVRIERNTLLWNRDAVTIKEDGDTSFFPRIRLSDDITDAAVTGNITTRILHGPDVTLAGNVLVSWTATDAHFVGRHFMDVVQGGDVGPGGWRLRPDSPWVGTGATASQPGG
jgi:hypothetical protein